MSMADVGGVYRTFLARHGADAVLIRPDYHVYGAASGLGAAAALVDDLRARLILQERGTYGSRSTAACPRRPA